MVVSGPFSAFGMLRRGEPVMSLRGVSCLIVEMLSCLPCRGEPLYSPAMAWI